MRLKRLKIGDEARERGYKNFLNTTVEFEEESKYCTFIGLNGSGKSNLLEAISKIFRSLYLIQTREERVDFDFEIDYQITINDSSHDIKITFIGNNFKFSSSVNGRVNQGEYKDYLPKQIIANYSGEESRLWKKVYLKFYKDYTRSIRQQINTETMKMLYLNKYIWDIALITLLCLEDEIIFDMLNISNEDINDINIIFDFNITDYPKYAVNDVIAFIDNINPNRNEQENVPLINIKFNETLKEEGTQKYINLFNYLYIAYMPENNKIITGIDIEIRNFTSKGLSEGEKKMILVRLISHLSKDKETLILFDEPDSHIHVSRKKDLAKTIIENNQFTIITTHSPTLINHFDEKNITMLIPSNKNGIETKKADSFEHIKHITDNSFSLFDTSLAISTKKHILMCEGINDLKYIKKALEILNSTMDNKYKTLEDNVLMINCGGASNIKPIFDDIVKDNLDTTQICIMIFDNDNPGRTGRDNIQKVIDTESLTNVHTFVHPYIHANQKGDFYMEDYFNVDTCKNLLIEKINNFTNFKSLDRLEKAKKVINNNYLNFENNVYTNFHILLDELLLKFRL